jgi:hypothetical protein
VSNQVQCCQYRWLLWLQRGVPPLVFATSIAAEDHQHPNCLTSHLHTPSALVQNPVAINPWRLFTEYTTGKSSIAECIEMNERLPVKIILVPRPGKGRPAGAQLLQPTHDLHIALRHPHGRDDGTNGTQAAPV